MKTKIKIGIVIYALLLCVIGIGNTSNAFTWERLPYEKADAEADILCGLTAVVCPSEAEIIKVEQEVVRGTIREVSAYNVGVVAQNDSSPCTPANGENICEAVKRGYKRCAANFVKLGTRLEIEGFGECLVVDRMNKRFGQRVDIALGADEIQKARQWGVKQLSVKIIKYETK
jgi:3D (Asp-Asp-Asp) domain-containing protein